MPIGRAVLDFNALAPIGNKVCGWVVGRSSVSAEPPRQYAGRPGGGQERNSELGASGDPLKFCRVQARVDCVKVMGRVKLSL